jgi:probable addiction module antidote protein
MGASRYLYPMRYGALVHLARQTEMFADWMPGLNAMPIKTTQFDTAEYLDSPEAIAAYLNDAIASGSDAEFIAALGTVARARGMSRIARETKLGRESLYKALGGTANPSFATVDKVLHSLGVQVMVTPTAKRIARGPRLRSPRPLTRTC